MGLLKFDEFLNEEEKVKLDRELREYTLNHINDDRFQLKSDDYYKEFSVLPYKAELLDKMKSVHEQLVESIEKMNIQDLYKAIYRAESLPYPYGNAFTSKYTLSIVPELLPSLDADQKQALANSEQEFLLNNFSQLGKEIKDQVLETMRERAEVLCAIIEALFYYVRTIDKDNFYQGMNTEELIEEYDAAIEKASKETSFSYDGPTADTKGEVELTPETRVAYWECEKNMKKFIIQATVLPSELYSEDNIGGTTGLKFSLLSTEDKNPAKGYDYFNIDELSARVKEFYNNILKK
jgi:hypothetical protein